MFGFRTICRKLELFQNPSSIFGILNEFSVQFEQSQIGVWKFEGSGGLLPFAEINSRVERARRHVVFVADENADFRGRIQNCRGARIGVCCHHRELIFLGNKNGPLSVIYISISIYQLKHLRYFAHQKAENGNISELYFPTFRDNPILKEYRFHK